MARYEKIGPYGKNLSGSSFNSFGGCTIDTLLIKCCACKGRPHVGISICLFLVFMVVSLRAYSKIFCMRQVNLEDYVGLVALAPYIGFVYGVYNLMRTTGIYVHQWNIRASTVPSALYIIYVNTSLFQATMGTIKAAILLEWIRVFVPRGTRTTFWWTCQVVMWANIIYYTTVVVVSAVQCDPHEKIWRPTIPGRCYNTRAFFISNAVINLTSDIIILLLPQKMIWSLKMSRRKKIGVSLVFAVGVIACLVGGARLTRGVIYYLSNDNIYNVSAVFLWCTAELSTSFLVFCLPAVPKIFSGDSWIKQLATRIHLRLSSVRTRLSDNPGTDHKLSTCDSSAFGGGPALEAGWDQPLGEPNPRLGRVAFHSTLWVYHPNTTKNHVPSPMNYETTKPNGKGTWAHAWSGSYDPSTSWYEEGQESPGR